MRSAEEGDCFHLERRELDEVVQVRDIDHRPPAVSRLLHQEEATVKAGTRISGDS